ncbi:MAG: hypothetical protein WA159_07200 [Variovorax sp.]
MAAQADDALPQITAATRPAASTLLEDFLPRAAQSSLVATQAPSASFQIDLYVLFMCSPSNVENAIGQTLRTALTLAPWWGRMVSSTLGAR